MKKLIIPILAIAAFVSLSGCGGDDRRGPYVRHDSYHGDDRRDRGPVIEVNTERRVGD